MTEIRILLVDDHPVVRQGLRSMLSAVPDFEVIGEAESGEEAINATMSSAPDVVLLDVRMPGQDGIQTARQIHQMTPHSRVIILTMHDDPEYVARALEAEVNGYLLKDCGSSEIINAVRRVMAGQRVVAAELAGPVFDDYVKLSKARTHSELDLTPDELGILEGMSAGMSYRTIASDLHLSEITVRRRVQEAYRKLGVSDRAEAVAVAIRRGLI